MPRRTLWVRDDDIAAFDAMETFTERPWWLHMAITRKLDLLKGMPAEKPPTVPKKPVKRTILPPANAADVDLSGFGKTYGMKQDVPVAPVTKHIEDVPMYEDLDF